MEDKVFFSLSRSDALRRFSSDGPCPQSVEVMLLHTDKNDSPGHAELSGASLSPASREYRQLEFNGQRIYNEEGFVLMAGGETFAKETVVKIDGCNNFLISQEEEADIPVAGRKFCFEISNSHNFALENIRTTGGRNFCLVSGCNNFTFHHCAHNNGEGFGIIIHNSQDFSVKDCCFNDMLAAGIMVVGSSSHGLISGCVVSASRGRHNCDAGIHLCATSTDVKADMLPEQCHEPLPILEKIKRPENIVIEKCRFVGNRAQGIYLEGAVACLVRRNIITGNNKEGICCDWGSCLNVLQENTVSFNGERKSMSREDIEVDFLDKFPLLPDGSCSMKLPGISLDNGSGNIIISNDIVCNYGGGVKMVRASLFNHIIENRIVNNAVGNNRYCCFYGVAFLGVGAVNREFDGNRKGLLDFYPSVDNRITGNIIQLHCLPFFHDRISRDNIFVGNHLDRGDSLYRRRQRFVAGLKRRFFRFRKRLQHVEPGNKRAR